MRFLDQQLAKKFLKLIDESRLVWRTMNDSESFIVGYINQDGSRLMFHRDYVLAVPSGSANEGERLDYADIESFRASEPTAEVGHIEVTRRSKEKFMLMAMGTRPRQQAWGKYLDVYDVYGIIRFVSGEQ
jgi:hypothetical protein